MKAFTVRLPDELAAQIETEACERRISKSEVARERLTRSPSTHRELDPLHTIRDLIGSVEDILPADLSSRKKAYLGAGAWPETFLLTPGSS